MISLVNRRKRVIETLINDCLGMTVKELTERSKLDDQGGQASWGLDMIETKAPRPFAKLYRHLIASTSKFLFFFSLINAD